MADTQTKSIIDEKIGNVTASNSNDKVVLLGLTPTPTGLYEENLELVVYPSDGTNEIHLEIPDSGYFMQLFLGDFTGDGISEIMLRGDFGGTGNFTIARIYTYKNGALEEIFNQEDWSTQNECEAVYLENYKVQISCPNTKNIFTLNIESYPKEYLDIIYTDTKKVKPYQSASVSYLNSAFPIKPTYQSHYDLLLLQRIVGIANADTLGYIQTHLSYKNNQFTTNQKGLLTFDRTSNNTPNNIEDISHIQNLIQSQQMHTNFYELVQNQLDIHSFSSSIINSLQLQLDTLQKREILLYKELGVTSLPSRRNTTQKHSKQSSYLNKMLLKSVNNEYNLYKKYRNALLQNYSEHTKNSLSSLLEIQLKKCSMFLCMQHHLRSLHYPTRQEIYYGNEFNISRNNLDLIVNAINEDKGTLYLDGYILNLKDIPLSEITNFKLTLTDVNNKIFAEKIFDKLEIDNVLKPYEGKRIFLSFYNNEYNLLETDTSNISWNYTYHSR